MGGDPRGSKRPARELARVRSTRAAAWQRSATARLTTTMPARRALAGAALWDRSGVSLSPTAHRDPTPEIMTRNRLVPLIVASALFMENTDSTVIATSLPAIAADLGDDPIALKLALTSYLVSLAIFIPVSGWIADRFGARTVFRAALGVFMAGSLACAASDSLVAFVARPLPAGDRRRDDGAGRAPRHPAQRPEDRARLALAYLTIPALIGPVVGPPLGGFITTYFDWRWIFFINIPIGLVGIVLATLFIPNVREPDPPPLDRRGFLLSAPGLALLMLGFATTGGHLLPFEGSLACVAVGDRPAPRLPAPRRAGRAPADPARAASPPDLPRQRPRRLAVPGRDRRDPVPPAADAADRLRAEPARNPGCSPSRPRSAPCS